MYVRMIIKANTLNEISKCVHHCMAQIFNDYYCLWLLLQKGKTALHEASAEGHAEIIQMLHSKGASIEAKDKVSQCILCTLQC